MFREFLRRKRELPESEKEHLIAQAVTRALEKGGSVNMPTIHVAFRDAQQMNEREGWGLTNNHLLNILEKIALHGLSGRIIEETLYGGAEARESFIRNEIASIKREMAREPSHRD